MFVGPGPDELPPQARALTSMATTVLIATSARAVALERVSIAIRVTGLGVAPVSGHNRPYRCGFLSATSLSRVLVQRIASAFRMCARSMEPMLVRPERLDRIRTHRASRWA